VAQQPQPDDKTGYKVIAAELRTAIKSGEISERLAGPFEKLAIRPGGKLPSETVLMGAYGVSRGTIRDAFAALRAEGLVEARRGSGVFIRVFRPLLRNATQRLSKKVWGAGRSIWAVDIEERPLETRNLRVEKVPAPEMIAACFGIPTGTPVWMRDRDYAVEGRTVQRATSYLPAELVEGSPITQESTGPGGTYARLADLGHAPVRFREELKARMPTAEETSRLGLATGTPVIEIARTAFDADDQPVEVNEMVLDASSYLLQYDFTS
jgi:GntR family transcriptional regulator